MERWAIISLIFWPPAIFCRTEELNTEISHDCYQPILNLHYLHCRIDRVNINDSDIRFWNDSLYFVDGRCSKKFYVIDISAIYRCDLRSKFVRSLRIRLQNENRRISKRFASPTITLKSAGLYFEQNEYRTSVTEEDSVDHSVIEMKATRNPTLGTNSRIFYRMIPKRDSRSSTYFFIDPNTGIVTVKRPLDRETISEHVFRVTAYELTKNDQFFSSSLNFENDQSASTQLVIRVLDVNDHLPIFDKSVYVGSISESVEIGTTVLHVHARDEDEDLNGKIDYSIDEDEADQNFSDFQLDLETGILKIKRQLDREKVDFYRITVKACDRGGPLLRPSSSSSLLSSYFDESSKLKASGNDQFTISKDPAHASNCGSALVEITVEDENDNYPQFSHVTNVDIDENLDSTVRPLIAKISAYDPDLGDNGRIHYSIVSGNGHNKFSLDYKTGEIRLIDKLNHKQTPRYELLIRAQDSGLVPLSNMTLLIINVKDVNDNPPKFYSSFIQETIPEDATLGFSIVRIQAYDSDSGENSRVSYSIHGIIDDEDGPSFLENLPFKIDSTSGWISVVGLLDREKRNSYDFRVKAKDHGTPELFSFIKVNIQVADVNDNPPVFDEKFYNVSVPESAQKGSEILKVTAKDKDETAGRLDYFIISGNDDETFMLLNQADGGLLTVNKKLDYRIQPSYVLSLRVADTGGFFDICQVYVEILDVNSPPYFSEYHLYPIVVSEQEPINSTVAVIRAEDSDDGENARLLYKMDGHRGGHFRIDGVSGAIMINRKLDRETISKYNLIITVLDNGKPPLSTSTELEIVIDDFNDNYPIFQKPNYTVSIPEDLPIGTSFLQVSANDNDSGQNGRLSYAILTAENDGKDFYVDPSSGVLRVNKSLDREKVAEYNLTLIASDKGSPPLTSSTIVRIVLDDINDNAPKFDKDVYDILVPENSLLESKIFTLKAHDPDYGKNAQITFKIFGGSDAASFELVADTVDPNSVDILLKTDLDYESSKKFYNFQVKADSGDLNSIVDIRIFVTDVNDHAPILNDFRFIFNNYPGRFRLASSARVPAKDLDVNDTLRFWIADQENETARKFDPFGVKSLLDVDQFTGIITLKSNLNTNRDVFGNIVVCVSDGANKRCAACQLKVTLITEEILISSVTVRLSGHTVSSFLDAHIYGRFLDALSTLLPSSVDDIIVFSVKDDRQALNVSESILNVSLTLKRPDSDNYVSAGELQELIHLNRQHLSELTHLNILPFDDNLCVREPCLNFERCNHVLKFGEASPHLETTDTMLFRSIHPINTFICTCPEGYAGMKKSFLCDTEINLCYSSPCGPNGTCISRENGYNCLCPPNYTGRNCEFPLSTEFCAPGLCSGSSHCKFFDSNLNRIARPLKNVQQKGLNSQKVIVECTNCPYDRQFSNEFCQLTARSFFHQSFVTFPPIKQRNRFEISLKFSSVKSDGLLFYNGRYQLEDDLLVMALRRGNLIVYISLGSPKIEELTFPMQRGRFSDGSWHTVSFKYYNRTMTLSVDGCDERIGLMKSLAATTPTCAVEKTIVLDRRCHDSSVACYRLLDLTGPLYVGGLPHNAKNFRMDPTEIPSFSGCIADFYINGNLLDMNRYVTNVGSVEGCRWMKNLCSGKQICAINRSRSCRNIWNGYKCDCLDSFAGQNCSSIVDEPIHLQSDDSRVEYNFKSKFETSFVFGLSVRITTAENRTSSAIIYTLEFGTGLKLSAFLAPGAKLCINFGEQEFQADIYNYRAILDDLWFTIIIAVNDNELIVNIDYVNVTTFALNEIFHDKMTKILIGSESHHRKAFTGCVKGVFIGRTLHEPEYLSVKTVYNVKRGCPRLENCLECPKNAKCDAKKSKCQCLPGFYGPHCEFEVCSKHLNPCLNGARCQLNNASVFYCECLFGFWGDRCQFKDPLAINGGRCPKTWFGHYPLCVPCKCDPAKNNDQDCDKVTGQCYCKPYYYKKEPNSDICLPCKCHFPTGASSLMCDDFTGQCKCKNRIKGRRCTECSRKNEQINRKIGKCETVKYHCPESFHSEVLWPRTSFNTTVTVRCPKGTSGYAQRTCLSDTIFWSEPMLINCTSKRFEYLDDMLSQIESTSLQLNSYLSQQIASYLNNLTSKSLDILYGRDLHITHNLLLRLIEEELKSDVISREYGRTQDKKFIKNIVASSSEILKQDVAKLWLQNYDHEPTIEVLKQVELLDKYGTFYAKSISAGSLMKPFRIDSENIVFVIDTVDQDLADVLRLPKYDNIVVNQQRNGNGHTMVKAELDMAREQQISTAFYAIYSYIEDLFSEFEYYSSEISQSHQPTVKRLISPILSLSLLNHRGHKIEKLKQPIRISFDLKGKIISTTNNLFCAWLKFEKVIEWVSDGCEIWSKNETHVTCSCDHLSTFAIVSKENANLEAFNGDVFQYFGTILPVLWTLLLVLIFVHRRYRLKSGIGSFGHLSYYIIMFISMNYVATVLAYSFSMNIARHQTACSWTYLSLQYVFLSLFLWLVIWPVHLYRKVAELKNTESRFLWIYVFFGQGISTFIGLLSYTHIDEIPFRKPIFRCARVYRHPTEWLFVGLIVISAFISCCLHILCIAICRTKNSNSKKPVRLNLKIELTISFCFDIFCILNFVLISFVADANLPFTNYVFQTISSLTFFTIIAFVYIDGKKFAEKQGFWKNKTDEMMTSKSVGDTSTDDPSAVVSRPGSPDERLTCGENAEHRQWRHRFASPSLAAKNSLKNQKQRCFQSTTPNLSPPQTLSSNDEDGEATPLTLGQKRDGRRRVEYNDLNVDMSTPISARRDLTPGREMRRIAAVTGERQDRRPDLIPSWESNQELRLLAEDIDATGSNSSPVYSIVNKKDIRQPSNNGILSPVQKVLPDNYISCDDNYCRSNAVMSTFGSLRKNETITSPYSQQNAFKKTEYDSLNGKGNVITSPNLFGTLPKSIPSRIDTKYPSLRKNDRVPPSTNSNHEYCDSQC